MEKGDLVIFSPQNIPGALTAVKYINTIHNKVQGTPGIVLEVNDSSCRVNFGGKILVINKRFLVLM